MTVATHNHRKLHLEELLVLKLMRLRDRSAEHYGASPFPTLRELELHARQLNVGLPLPEATGNLEEMGILIRVNQSGEEAPRSEMFGISEIARPLEQYADAARTDCELRISGKAKPRDNTPAEQKQLLQRVFDLVYGEGEFAQAEPQAPAGLSNTDGVVPLTNEQTTETENTTGQRPAGGKQSVKGK